MHCSCIIASQYFCYGEEKYICLLCLDQANGTVQTAINTI